MRKRKRTRTRTRHRKRSGPPCQTRATNQRVSLRRIHAIGFGYFGAYGCECEPCPAWLKQNSSRAGTTMALNWLDIDQADFLPLGDFASAREVNFLESRGLQHVELLPTRDETIDLDSAGRCLALGKAKDIPKSAQHLELHRAASGCRQIYYGKVIPLLVGFPAPAFLLGFPRRPMHADVDGVGRLYARNSSLQFLGKMYRSACLAASWWDIDLVAAHIMLFEMLLMESWNVFLMLPFPHGPTVGE
jgi:hypothetical protein